MHMRMIHEREENGLGTQSALIVCDCGNYMWLDDDETNECAECERLYNRRGAELMPRTEWPQSRPGLPADVSLATMLTL